MGAETGIVTCKCGGMDATGIYELSGPHLILRSNLGAFKTMAGLRDPRRTARKLLKNVCTGIAKKQRCQCADRSVLMPSAIAAVRGLRDAEVGSGSASPV